MKKQLLDPLGTVCKLVALNFHEQNTKISIQNHILTLQKPNNYQFLIRIYNGDGRENISEIYYALVRIIKWYLVPDEEYDCTDLLITSNSQHIVNNNILRKMLKYLCMGLRKLQETYEFGNVVLAIQYYINLIEDGLEGKFDESRLPKYIINLDKEDDYKNLIDFDKLKNFWDIKKLTRICELYDNCFKLTTDTETPSKTRDALIHGYLESVGAILEITDQEFQQLLFNSSKG